MSNLTAIDGGAGTPPEPDWSLTFSDAAEIIKAHEEWTAVISELKEAEALTVANGHAIKRLVVFRLLYDRTADTVVEQGAVVPAKRTKVPSHSAHWTVLRQSAEVIAGAEAELGIAPTRRGKLVPVKRRKAKPRAADAYTSRDG